MHDTPTATQRSDPKSLTFTIYLLNPHPLEAEGLYCGKLSIFKLDILVIS